MSDDIDIILCTAFDMHPYECGGEKDGCIHCLQTKTEDHNPNNCALCHYMDDEV